MKKKVLVLCPTRYDNRALRAELAKKEHDFMWGGGYDGSKFSRVVCPGHGWLTEDFDPHEVVSALHAYCKNENIGAILCGEDYPGSLLASIATDQAGLPGPSPRAMLQCQHKYYSRLAQQESVPEAVPQFMLIDPRTCTIDSFEFPFPAFIKPIKSVFSVLSYPVRDRNELQGILPLLRMPHEFITQFGWFTSNYGQFPIVGDYYLLERAATGLQITLEGFVCHGEVTILGITDSLMYPGTMSFARFEYPSSLPPAVQMRMAAIARKYMQHISFDNGFFNFEMMYDHETDAIMIIEINPRIVAQFADLYELVDGISSYSYLLSLALGRKPSVLKKQGMYAVAASCVLRIFEDKEVLQVPSSEEIASVEERFPGTTVHVLVQPGSQLSEAFQDGKSYRYALIHLGAQSRDELEWRLSECLKMLPFVFI